MNIPPIKISISPKIENGVEFMNIPKIINKRPIKSKSNLLIKTFGVK
jgi:hypothetical protein